MTMQMDDGSQINEIVSGGLLFTPGQIYRIYLHSSEESEVVSALPEAQRPVQTLLGYERIDSESFSEPASSWIIAFRSIIICSADVQ